MSARNRLARRAQALMERSGISYEHLLGVRFAVNVFVATAIVWFVLQKLADTNPIWAIASMVAASEPDPAEARRMFRSRLINVAVGCVTGLFFLVLGGARPWTLPLALATAVLVATYVVRVKTMWRQAPITAAVVIAASLLSNSTERGIVQGLHKVAEVVFGCVVGLVVSWTMSRLWLVRRPLEADARDHERVHGAAAGGDAGRTAQNRK